MSHFGLVVTSFGLRLGLLSTACSHSRPRPPRFGCVVRTLVSGAVRTLVSGPAETQSPATVSRILVRRLSKTKKTSPETRVRNAGDSSANSRRRDCEHRKTFVFKAFFFADPRRLDCEQLFAIYSPRSCHENRRRISRFLAQNFATFDVGWPGD